MNNIRLEDANATLAANNLSLMMIGNKKEQLAKLQIAAMYLRMASFHDETQTKVVSKNDLYVMKDLLQDSMELGDEIIR